MADAIELLTYSQRLELDDSDFTGGMNSAQSSFSKFTGGLGTAVKGVTAGFAAISGAAVGAGTAVYKLVSDTAEAGDNIDELSQSIGLSREGFQEWDYILSSNGASIDSMGVAMKTLISGSDATNIAFEKLGVKITDSMSQEEIFETTIKALQGMDEGVEKSRLATDLFGKQAQSLAPVLNSDSDSIQALKDEAHNLGMVMSDETIDSGANFADTMVTLDKTISGVKNSISAEFLPAFKDGADALIGFATGADDTGEMLDSAINGIMSGISNLMPKVLEAGSQLITSLIGGITSSLPKFFDSVMKIIPDMINRLISLLPQIVNVGLKMITSLANGIGNSLPTLIPSIVDIILQIVQSLIDNIPMLVNAALQIITGLAEGLIAAIPVITEKLPVIIQSIVDTLLGSITTIIEAGIKLFSALVEELPTIIIAITKAIPEILQGISTALIDNMPTIINAGIKLFTALINDLPTIITNVAAAIPQLIEGLISAFTENLPFMIQTGIELFVAIVKDIPTIIKGIVNAFPAIFEGIKSAWVEIDWGTLGLNLIKGLWQGIKDASAWLMEKLGGFSDEVITAIKDKFGIHSPSTVFADLGGFMSEGLGLGFIKNMKNITKDMQNSIPTTEIATTGLLSQNQPVVNKAAAISSNTRNPSANASNVVNNSDKANHYDFSNMSFTITNPVGSTDDLFKEFELNIETVFAQQMGKKAKFK